MIRLRATEPALERPSARRGDMRIRGVLVPLPALIGAPLTFVIWIISLGTHQGALVAGPVWVVLGLVDLRADAQRAGHEPLLGRATPGAADLVPGARGHVRHDPRPAQARPDRRGGARDRDQARGGARRQRPRAARREACRSRSRWTPRWRTKRSGPPPRSSRRRSSPASTGSAVEGRIVRARAIGEAIVAQARDSGAELVVLGSAPRWRRQSRFFSPTVDYVLRHADCRGDGRRLPARRARGERRDRFRALMLTREGNRDRLRPGGVTGCEEPGHRGLGRRRHRRERGGPEPPRRDLVRRLLRRPRHGHRTAARRPASRTPTRS